VISKRDLRAQIVPTLQALDLAEFQNAGNRVCRHLASYFEQNAAIFKSLPQEIDTSGLIKAFSSVLLPGADPEAYAQQILDAGIQLVLVPGLAFDPSFNRLGRGGGYYDRCIAALRRAPAPPKIIGLCLEQQVLNEIPVEAHDQKVDALVTPSIIRDKDTVKPLSKAVQ